MSKKTNRKENTAGNSPVQENQEAGKEPFDLKKEIISWIEVIAAAVVIAFLINSFIIVNATVPTGSMENTIMPKDRLFGLRIIGLPGETVEIRNAKIYIDGSDTPLDEPYLKEEWVVFNDGITFEVPEDCYLMLGDNRNNSSDSRYWALVALQDYAEAGKEITKEEAWALSFVKRKQILGKAYVRYWPLTKISMIK